MSTLITTTAQIGTIKDAGGNQTAMTVDAAGNVTFAKNNVKLISVFSFLKNSNSLKTFKINTKLSIIEKTYKKDLK